MKKKLLFMLVLFICWGAVSFASIQSETTFGVFLNNIDRIMSPVYIFDSSGNIADVGLKSWTGSSLNWGTTVGFGISPDLKLGIGLYDRENFSTPSQYENLQVTYRDLNGDFLYDTKTETTTRRNEFRDSTLRALQIVGSLGSLSVGYNFGWVHNSVEGYYNPDTGEISTSSIDKTYDLSGNLLSENGTTYGMGYDGIQNFTNILVVGFNLGSLRPFIGIGVGYLSDGFYGISTNYTKNTGTVIEDPYFRETVRKDNENYLQIGGTPGVLYIMNPNPDDYMEVVGAIGVEYDILLDSVVNSYKINTITKSLSGSFVSTTEEKIENSQIWQNYFSLPLLFTLSTRLNKKITENLRFGIGATVLISYKMESYKSLGTNKTETKYNDGDVQANDPDDYTTIVEDYRDTYEYNRNLVGFNLGVPVGLEVLVTKFLTLRFGVDFTYNYENNFSKTMYLDSQPTKTTTVYGDGTSTTTYGTPGNPTSSQDVGITSITTVYFSTGLGLNFDNLVIDLKLQAAGDIFNLNNWALQCLYKF